MQYTNEFVDVFPKIRRFLWSLIKIVGCRNCFKDDNFLEFAVFSTILSDIGRSGRCIMEL